MGVDRHALVAHVDDDPRPVGPRRWHPSTTSKATSALLPCRTSRAIELTALVSNGNTAALTMLRRVAKSLHVRYEGSELSVRVAIA
jgi:hypothetical protein